MFDFLLHLGPGETAIFFICAAAVVTLIGRSLLSEPETEEGLTLTPGELRTLVSEAVEESTAPLRDRIDVLEARQQEALSLPEASDLKSSKAYLEEAER